MTSGHRGEYFRWKEDICRVIEERWDELCPNRIKSGNWMNSISSILSANGGLFASGFGTMKQSGWWALKEKVPPTLPESTTDGRKRRGVATVIGSDKLPESKEVVAESSPQSSSSAKKPKLEDSSPVSLPLKPIEPRPIQQFSRPPTMPVSQQFSQPAAFTGAPLQMKPRPIMPAKAGGPTSVVDFATMSVISETEDSNRTALSAASEIKRKLVERLLKVDSTLLKAALTKDSSVADHNGKSLNPIMYIPPGGMQQQRMTPKPQGQQSENSPATSAADRTKKDKKKPRPANYVRASPYENELFDVCNRILNPNATINRLKRKLQLRRVT